MFLLPLRSISQECANITYLHIYVVSRATTRFRHALAKKMTTLA